MHTMNIHPRATALILMAVTMAPFVNARGASAEAVRINLAGEWRFALDRSAEQVDGGSASRGVAALPPGDSLAQEWFKRDLTNRIRVPGILQAQGYGNDISTNTPWVLALGDA